MIYRKATVAIPDANYLSSRAQNRGFCALVMETLASGNRKARKFFVFARF